MPAAQDKIVYLYFICNCIVKSVACVLMFLVLFNYILNVNESGSWHGHLRRYKHKNLLIIIINFTTRKGIHKPVEGVTPKYNITKTTKKQRNLQNYTKYTKTNKSRDTKHQLTHTKQYKECWKDKVTIEIYGCTLMVNIMKKRYKKKLTSCLGGWKTKLRAAIT